MLLRVVRPVKRRESTVPQFGQRIPLDVKAKAIGLTVHLPVGSQVVPVTISPNAQAVRTSLRTHDPSEAKVRNAAVAAHLETVWQRLRTHDGRRAPDMAAIARRHVAALLAKDDDRRSYGLAPSPEEAADMLARHHPDDPPGLALLSTKGLRQAAGMTPAHLAEWGKLVEHNEAVARDALARRDAAFALGYLNDNLPDDQRGALDGFSTDQRREAAFVFLRAHLDAVMAMQRRQKGDDVPTPQAPSSHVDAAQPATPSRAGGDTLTGLVDAWWIEAKATGLAPSTEQSYRNTMKRLVAFLGHDDARRVTPADVIRFKDARLAEVGARTGKPISPKTVKDSDLAGLKSVFGWAVANRKLTINPAAGVTIKLGKQVRLRSKGFTDDEATAILSHASTHRPAQNERAGTTGAKRWVPWLCAYSGARVGEMAQLRKQDIRREGDHWVLTVTPEAGRVKTKEAREVPLHPHLIEMGFPEFVAGRRAGHLFVTPAADGSVLGPLKGLTNRLSEFAREVAADPNVDPNHGWRHRFKTVGLEAGASDRVLDAICGHAPKTVGATYGDVTVRTRADAIARLPRYEIG